jgi:hypothetical protein
LPGEVVVAGEIVVLRPQEVAVGLEDIEPIMPLQLPLLL